MLFKNARHVNDSMPSYVAKLTLNGLKHLNVSTDKAKIAILGLSYLEESDDTRNSPTVSLIETLSGSGAEIAVHDHYVQEHDTIDYTSNLEDVVSNADAVVVMVSHRLYSEISPDYLKQKMRNLLIVDARNIFHPEHFISNGFEFSGVGRGSTWN